MFAKNWLETDHYWETYKNKAEKLFLLYFVALNVLWRLIKEDIFWDELIDWQIMKWITELLDRYINIEHNVLLRWSHDILYLIDSKTAAA